MRIYEANIELVKSFSNSSTSFMKGFKKQKNMSEANNAATSISMPTGGGLPVSAPNIPQSNMNGMNGSNQDSNLLEGLPKVRCF